jgi:ABC-type nitrate/sulfonate/bicarbonate transport system permease component
LEAHAVDLQRWAIERSLFPLCGLAAVTPIVAIAPLIIILVKNTTVALTLCATVVALFPIGGHKVVDNGNIPGIDLAKLRHDAARVVSLLAA